jgi:sugar phosphate isomerase/epimerase
MAIGWCARIERGGDVKRVGYDFLEVALAPMNLEDDQSYRTAKAAASATPLATPVFNQFLPKSMYVVGPDVDRDRVVRYLERVADIAQAADGEIVVFGSGWARNVPEGWSRERADDQFLEMVGWSTDALKGTGVTLALEAQNHTETNYMTTIADAVRLAKLVNHPAVRVIADIYHLYMEPEPFDIVTDAADWIVHVHLSDVERKTPGTGTYDFQPLFDRLRASGYAGRLSVECMTEIPEPEMTQTLAWVRDHWNRT